MRRKHEGPVSPTLFYCFGDLARGPGPKPFTYVVLVAMVAANLAECHQARLDQPGKKEQQRYDGGFRRFLPDYPHLEMGRFGAGWREGHREARHLLQRTVEA